jgi:hypothetical protein
MVVPRYRAIALALVFAVAGCVSDTGAPREDGVARAAGAAGEDAASGSSPRVQPVAAPPITQIGTLRFGDGNFQPGGVSDFPDTGTAVGDRVQQLAGELEELQTEIADQNGRLQEVRAAGIEAAQTYFDRVSRINARLQVGTTPGNPILVEMWNEAEAALDRFNGLLAEMNQLANRVSASSSNAAFLLESVRATYGLSGAVDEDHRHLNVLEDETSQTVVLIDRLATELSQDISRTNSFLTTERANLQALQLAVANGELYGLALSNRVFIGSVPRAVDVREPQAGAIGAATGQPPLVVIRFEGGDVDYEQPLYQAVAAALDRRPEAVFDLVAVSPERADQGQQAIAANRARTEAERVLRTLIDMGLPPSRVTLSSATSPGVTSSEVQLYVR